MVKSSWKVCFLSSERRFSPPSIHRQKCHQSRDRPIAIFLLGSFKQRPLEVALLSFLLLPRPLKKTLYKQTKRMKESKYFIIFDSSAFWWLTVLEPCISLEALLVAPSFALQAENHLGHACVLLLPQTAGTSNTNDYVDDSLSPPISIFFSVTIYTA